MIVDLKGDPESQAVRQESAPVRRQSATPAGGSTTDEMSECSFPASDPPSVWTWEVNSRTDSEALLAED
jgi:hypothetical protein